jgi:hypothetical protein
MRRTGSRRSCASGLTLLELVVSAALSVLVLGGAAKMIDASSSVSKSTNDAGYASWRVDTALNEMSDAIHRGSLASARKLDGTTFTEGTTDVGFQIRQVTGFRGVPTTSGLVTYRWDGTTKEVVRQDGIVYSVIARNVTSFSITRTVDVFTISVEARSGPKDDRSRKCAGAIQVCTRNP